MPTGAYPGADRGCEPVNFAGIGDLVVELAKARAGLNPCRLVGHFDLDVAEVEHVEDDERDAGDRSDALEVMASAADSYL